MMAWLGEFQGYLQSHVHENSDLQFKINPYPIAAALPASEWCRKVDGVAEGG